MKNNLGCYVISLLLEYYDTSTSLLTDSKEEQIILMIDLTLVGGTRSRKLFLNWATIKSFYRSSTFFVKT